MRLPEIAMVHYSTRYPKLKYFFSAYFCGDWPSLYASQGDVGLFNSVVREFMNSESVNMVHQARNELKKLIAQNLAEPELKDVIVHQLGANIYAPGIGATYRQWAKAVLDILETS